MDELLEQFLIEGRELVEQASNDALAIEGGETQRIASLFRAIHTLKGSAALFDFAPMSEMLHEAENLLDALRGEKLSLAPPMIDAILSCITAMDGWLDDIARTSRLPIQAAALSQNLKRSLAACSGTMTEIIGDAIDEPTPDWLPALLAAEADARAEAEQAGHRVVALRYIPRADCFFLGDDPIALVRSVPDLIALKVTPREAWPDSVFDAFTCNLVIEVLSTAPATQIRDVFRFVSDQVTIAAVEPARDIPEDEIQAALPEQALGQRSLRVDAARIDQLIAITGELVVAKNGLAHLIDQWRTKDAALARALDASQAEIERLTGRLYRTVLSVRMVPLSQTFGRLPRAVREAAASLGKTIDFEIEGSEVEADKTIADGLFEPLLHILRNAADHGLESADARAAAGKPAVGHITLKAMRDGDHVGIEIADDGAGIDPKRIRAVALERGLIDAAIAESLDEAATLDLVFRPGFSTARDVTAVSGRGVGMDAVRTAITAMGGHVGISTRLGRGTTVRLRLPQAAALTTVMTVLAGAERFGVPLDAVTEIARVPSSRITAIGSGEAFVLRNRTIPLLRLSRLLDLTTDRNADILLVLVVIGRDGERIGFAVDGFAERIDVLLRPMSGLVASLPGFLGTALLGDGSVLLVLDLPELAA